MNNIIKLTRRSNLRLISSRSFALREVTMPAVSPTMTQGNLLEYYYNVNDFVDVGEAIVNIETDKANVTLDIQEEGYLAKIVHPAGTNNIKVGDLIMYMVDEEEELSRIDQLIKESSSSSSNIYFICLLFP